MNCPGAPSKIYKVNSRTEDYNKFVGFKRMIEAKVGRSYKQFHPVKATSQCVNGTNYQIRYIVDTYILDVSVYEQWTGKTRCYGYYKRSSLDADFSNLENHS